MSAASLLRYCYLTWFSQPVADRAIYKAVRKRTLGSIVELGVGRGQRARRLFEICLKPCHAEAPLRYTGIDLFEARQDAAAGLSLKQAFALLKRDHVKLQLVPGDPHSALARAANTLAETDLLIISQDQVGESLKQAWRYVPRMIHAETLIFLEQPGKKPGETQFGLLRPLDVQRWAAEAVRAQRRAA